MSPTSSGFCESTALPEAHDISRGLPERPRKRLSLARLGRLRKPGLRLAVLRPITLVAAVVLAVIAAAWMVPGLIDSAEQRAVHRAPVHSDRSGVKTGIVAQFTRPRTLIYRDVNGTRHLLLADDSAIGHFVDDALIFLETERNAIKAETQKKVDALLENAFSDGRDSINSYADWYFAWGRSWSLLKESAVGTLKGLAPNNVQGFSEAARNEVEAYLIRNYQRFVLKPEMRDPIIEAGISRILAEAHARYLDTLTAMDERVQIFLNTYTRHLEVVGPLDKLDVSVDWDAQKWKAPRYSVDDEAFQAAYRGATFIAFSGLVAGTLSPLIERAIAQVFVTTASRLATALEPQIIGFAAGSVAEPGVGSLVGCLIGAGGALIVDYAFNRGREHFDRAEFEDANEKALKMTLAEFSRALQRDLSQAIDVWFDDTRAIVAEQKLGKKLP